jgi:hypothetical protein
MRNSELRRNSDQKSQLRIEMLLMSIVDLSIEDNKP